jgi:hypothetical protein
MKNLILLLIVTSFASKVQSQARNIDTALKFDKVITAYEKHWVVLKRPDKVKYYTFGYVYIQSDQGFMFKPAGHFKIDRKNRYVLCKGAKTQYRFNVNSRDVTSSTQVIRQHDTTSFMDIRNIALPIVAVLPPQHFAKLKIEAEPEWVKPYYVYTDTLEHNYRWGCYHIEEGDSATGIDYLEKVYKVSPHYKGVKVPMDNINWFNQQGIELKLGAAYNYDKAIPVLKNAIVYDPTNLGLYIELNGAYTRKGDLPAAINACKQGLAQIKVDESQIKGWFAGVISNEYIALKDDEQGKYWRKKSDEYGTGLIY